MIRLGRFGTIRISASFITTVIMITIATDGAAKRVTAMDEIITTTVEPGMDEAMATAQIASRMSRTVPRNLIIGAGK